MPHTEWHFGVMILASFALFILMIRLVLNQQAFKDNSSKIMILALVIVVIGMLIGKYGWRFGLPWWIYYPLPALMTIILPPYVLKLNTRKSIYYWIMSVASAPLIHVAFSFLLGWKEYLPFWSIPGWWEWFLGR